MVNRKDERTYIRLHDGMPDHPKVVGLSDSAFRLYVEALCWCSRHLTDGAIPTAASRRLGSAKAQRELAAAGLFIATEDGWSVHDYLLHQRSAAEVEALRETRRAAGSKGGRAKANGLASAKQTLEVLLSKSVPETETEAETETEEKQVGGNRHLPSDPTPATYPTHCQDHRNVENPGPCGGCKKAREHAERSDQTRRERSTADLIAACGSCDPDGWALDVTGEPTSRRCKHRAIA